MTAPARTAGFTLLEMVIALAVLGLLTVMLSGSLQFGARAWESQNRRLEAYSETDAVHTVLRILLRNAQPMALARAGQQQAPAYVDGQRDSVEFVGKLPEAFGRSGFYDLVLAVEPDNRLVLRYRPHVSQDVRQAETGQDDARQADQTGGRQTGARQTDARRSDALWQTEAAAEPLPRYEEAELLRHVAALDLSYFAAGAPNRPGGWQATWNQGSALPVLIRVRLRFVAGDRRVWRDLQVAPVIRAAAAPKPPSSPGASPSQPSPSPSP